MQLNSHSAYLNWLNFHQNVDFCADLLDIKKKLTWLIRQTWSTENALELSYVIETGYHGIASVKYKISYKVQQLHKFC